MKKQNKAKLEEFNAFHEKLKEDMEGLKKEAGEVISRCKSFLSVFEEECKTKPDELTRREYFDEIFEMEKKVMLKRVKHFREYSAGVIEIFDKTVNDSDEKLRKEILYKLTKTYVGVFERIYPLLKEKLSRDDILPFGGETTELSLSVVTKTFDNTVIYMTERSPFLREKCRGLFKN